jgi:hypothetical protein
MTHRCKAPSAIVLAALLGAAAPVQQPPGFSNVKILTKVVNVTIPPPSPAIQLELTGGLGTLVLTWTGPSGEPFIQSFYGNLSGTTRVRATAAQTAYSWTEGADGFDGIPLFNGFGGFNLYTEPGIWTLSGISVCIATTCTATQNQNFGTITVTNPNTPDFKPPVAVSGTIETPNLSLSATHKTIATLAVNITDDVSGIRSLSAVAKSDTGYIMYFTSLQPPAPVLAARIEASTPPLSKRFSAGTYIPVSITLSDIAGNTSTITDPQTIIGLFGGSPKIVVSF